MSEKHSIKPSETSEQRPDQAINLFSPPWLTWNDQFVNKFKWNDIMEEETSKQKSRSKRSIADKKKSGGTRKSMAKKSIAGGKKKSIASVGSRKSLAKKSITGGKKKSIAGGSRKSVAKKSISGGKKKSIAGKKSITGGKKSIVGGKRKSMARDASKKQTLARDSKRSHLSADSKIRTHPLTDPYQKIEPSFVDPTGKDFLPASLTAKYWKRPVDIDPHMEWTLNSEPDPLDIFTHNEHLFKSKIMRHIVSSVMGLDKDASVNPFVEELQTSHFRPKTGENWKPSDHVYAWSVTGDGNKHFAFYNPYGLYIVRLFFMGAWKVFLVDDYFPYDSDGNLLLIRSRDPKNIWMQLLTKALLKIAALSWTTLDETMDFNAICCLTGWICNSVDVSLLEEEPMWKIIQGHAITSEHNPSRVCQPVDTRICVYDAMDVFLDKVGSRSVFIHIPDVVGDSTFTPCYEGLAYLKTAMNDTIPEYVPKWQTYRWVDWAYENGHIRGLPGTTRRIIELFVPLKRSGPIFIEDKPLESDSPEQAVAPHEINMYGHFQSDAFIHGSVYRYFKKIDIYFKRSYFEYVKSIENIPVDLLEHFKHDKVLKPAPQVVDPYVIREFFFLACSSSHCKNIFVTLSVLNEDRNSFGGYIMCEGYHWQSLTQGPCWFSIRTKGTRTQCINLGPGFQICRFWYSLPYKYLLTFHSKTMFYLSGRDENIYMQSIGSDAMRVYGEEMAEIFYQMLKTQTGTGAHGELLGNFITSFSPPNIKYSSLPTPLDPQGMLAQVKMNELFQDKLMELLFETGLEEDPIVQIIIKFQEFFLDPQFGERYLERFPEYEPILNKVRDIRKESEVAHRKAKAEYIKAIDGVEAKQDPKSRKSTSRKSMSRKSMSRKSVSRKSVSRKSVSRKSVSRKSVSKKSIKKKSISKKSISKEKKDSVKLPTKTVTAGKAKKKEKDESDEKRLLYSPYLLDFPDNNIALLKKMMGFEEDLLEKYPFRYDTDMKLSFYDYMGTSDITPQPLQNWIPMSAIVLNIHSQTPVPCGFFLFTENKRAHLELYDLDNGQQISLHFDMNCRLTRNKNGYALIAVSTSAPASEQTKTTNVSWRIRVFGNEQMNIPHQCLFSSRSIEKENEQQTINCKGEPGPQPQLKTDAIAGYYYPNPYFKVCRFLLKVDRSVVTSLTFSPSKKDARFQLTIVDANENQIVNQVGVGEIIVPAIALKFKDALFQPAVDGLPSYHYFLGEVKVYGDTWPITNKDAEILEDRLRRSPQPKYTPSASKLARGSMGVRKSSARHIISSIDPSLGPQWQVHMYTEQADAKCVNLTIDKRYEEGFYTKKKAVWEKDDPQRSETGQALRQEYLKEQMESPSRDSIKNVDPSSKQVSAIQLTKPDQKKGRKKSTSISPKDLLEGSMGNLKEEFVVPYPAAPKLLPELIDKFALPVPEGVVPIVVNPPAVRTNAPPHLGPFHEPLVEVEGEIEDENYERELPKLQFDQFADESYMTMDLAFASSNLPTAPSGSSGISEEIDLQKMKEEADRLIENAYRERDRLVHEMHVEVPELQHTDGAKSIKRKRTNKL